MGRGRETAGNELGCDYRGKRQSREAAIVAEHLVRRFGQVTAVNDVSFRVERGEIFGFSRAERQWKDHRHKMLTGLLPLSAGAAHVEGWTCAWTPKAVAREDRIHVAEFQFVLRFDGGGEFAVFYGGFTDWIRRD